uniref:TOG domain-containing protein n=1 Tax=Panagrolaimus superbus TaxID=310955 RepID=A0A914YS06_9BILA
MGSRLRSAPPATAGALKVSDFEQAFENTAPDNVSSAKTLPQRLQELNNFLTDGNKDWSQKSKLLISLRGCLIATNVPRAVDVVMDNCGLWERCLIDGLKELRSTLTREYCITIAFFAVKLQSRFIRQVELMFNNLMNLVQNSAKIMSSSGVILSEFIAKYVHHSKLITLTSGYLVSKSSVVRRSVVHMFDVMLSNWGKEILELHMNVIKEVIKSGLNDADVSCRTTSRNTYFVFMENFPSQAQELYDSLDTIRQRALNDQQRSAASSTNSLAHERDTLHLHSLKVSGPAATQQAFLDNRSRSDVHFRYNGTRPIPRAPPTRSRNTSPTRTNPHSPHSSKMRPAVFAKPLAIPKLPPPSARLNSVAPRINTNLRAIPSASSSRPPTNSQFVLRPRANGTAAVGSASSYGGTRANQATVFGTARNSAMQKSAIKPPTSAIPPPKYARPNVIRTVATPSFNDQRTNELTSSLNNLKLNSNMLTQSQHASITDSVTSTESLNGNGVSPIEHSLNDIISNIGNENVDVKRPEKIIESLKTLYELITTDQLTQQHYEDHFNVLLLYCTQLLRITDASNTLKKADLDALRALITAQPHRIADKAELVLFRVLDAQDRDDATLTRAAEDCGAAIVSHLSVERCQKILIPLISNDQVNTSSIASSLKLLCRKIETLSPEEVDQMFKDTRDVVVKSYEHPESMVRRASILFFVTVSNVIGTEPLRPYLAASIFKLVEVYRDKAQIKPRKASGY